MHKYLHLKYITYTTKIIFIKYLNLINRATLIILFFINSLCLLAQSKNDSIVLVNGNLIVCEIIGLENNRLQIDASYGYSNWEVKWHNVTSINTVNSFNVQLVNGEKFYGNLATLPSGEVLIKSGTSILKKTTFNEVVFLMEFKQNFLERLEGSISIGINLTKARDYRQLNTVNRLAYRTQNYKLAIAYDALVSNQESAELIQRSDGSFNYNHDLQHQYFTYFSTSILSNTEQQLDLRWSTQAGLGKLLISNNQLDWRFVLGINYNSEDFGNETASRESMEALLATRFEVFNLGDLKLYTNAKTYYSLTEIDRFRTDLKADLRYNIKYFKKSNLTNKIFIATSFSLNYDNKPANNASQIDYVFSTTLGFSWND
jgi:hypothetical protein